jgi:hypothetical protein
MNGPEVVLGSFRNWSERNRRMQSSKAKIGESLKLA